MSTDAFDRFDEDAEKEESRSKSSKGHTDFDCPSCDGNNPTDSVLANGDEIRCHYCGSEFKVYISGEGRMKLKEI